MSMIGGLVEAVGFSACAFFVYGWISQRASTACAQDREGI